MILSMIFVLHIHHIHISYYKQLKNINLLKKVILTTKKMQAQIRVIATSE